MAEIISIDDKLRRTRKKKATQIRRRKIQAVQNVFQCAHCAFKCSKCGNQIDPDDRNAHSDERDLRVPYRLCPSCAEEYIDYVDRLKGEGDPDYYWYNEAWLEVWRRWIDYERAKDSYLKSNEFMKLLRELKQTGPGK